ncbi:hypothetical protein KI387_017968 [Taxus chinensis]|uniref:Pentatricopeptide repeat-containing protein n=1 Tax=Taxus chinensis TaxID=29808 RepID=A0AA38LG95_TAXCH|nr:hypothetical protein KI387_017968 [Taxus chinensis]
MMVFYHGRMSNNMHFPRFNSTVFSIVQLGALCTEGRLQEAVNILLTSQNPPGDVSTYLQLLQTCIAKNALSEGKLIHSCINNRGYTFTLHTIRQNKLINMYDKCGSFVDAREVFDAMTERDAFSWNMIIAAYRRHGFPREALSLFNQMQPTDVVVANALIDMYTKCGSIQKARQLFDKIPERNAVSWNAIITGYAQNRVLDEALRLFQKMPR